MMAPQSICSESSIFIKQKLLEKVSSKALSNTVAYKSPAATLAPSILAPKGIYT
jgi:hypothetical protein